MKKALLILLGSIMFLSGCSSAKKTFASQENQKLHQQAVAALESSQFTIEGYEFFMSGKKKQTLSTGSYISVDNNNCRIYIEQHVMPGSPVWVRTTESSDTVISEEPGEDNKGIKYKLTLRRPNQMEKIILITLYPGTNECLVYFVGRHGGFHNLSFQGLIHPLTSL